MELVQIYFKNWNKITIITMYLHFFMFLFDNLFLLDPETDPGGTMNADPYGTGSIPQPWLLCNTIFLLNA